MHDPHSYPPPHNEVLRNIPHTLDKSKLQKFESSKSSERIDELQQKPIVGTFNAQHLSAIHKYIFQDVYPWAGEYRAVGLFKPERVLGGATVDYAQPEEIDAKLTKAFESMKAIDFSRSLSDVSEQMAKAITEIWTTHPFREGNTRTITTFIASYVKTKGHEIDVSTLVKMQDGDSFRDTLVAASYDMPEHLQERFKKALSRANEIASASNKAGHLKANDGLPRGSTLRHQVKE